MRNRVEGLCRKHRRRLQKVLQMALYPHWDEWQLGPMDIQFNGCKVGVESNRVNDWRHGIEFHVRIEEPFQQALWKEVSEAWALLGESQVQWYPRSHRCLLLLEFRGKKQHLFRLRGDFTLSPPTAHDKARATRERQELEEKYCLLTL